MAKICISCKGVKNEKEMVTKRSSYCKECFDKVIKIKIIEE